MLARRSQIVPDLTAALQRVQEKFKDKLPSFLSFISGPSRTGDIERILVLGRARTEKIDDSTFALNHVENHTLRHNTMITSTEPNPNAARASGLFRLPEAGSYFVTFALVTSLFLLWGFCNGMIDILNKHFQDSLQLNQRAIGSRAVRQLPRLFPHGNPRRFDRAANSATKAAFSRPGADCRAAPFG